MNETNPTISTLLTPGNITFALGLIGVMFTVYRTLTNPQIQNDKETIELKSDIVNLKSEIKDIKETHLRTLENEIKALNTSVSNLSGTVIKLATIIDERIPKGRASLTPPGQ